MAPTLSTCRRAATVVVALALCLAGSGAGVAQDEAGFQAFVQILAREAASRGVSRATIDAVVPTLRLNPRVIALDRARSALLAKLDRLNITAKGRSSMLAEPKPDSMARMAG